MNDAPFIHLLNEKQREIYDKVAARMANGSTLDAAIKEIGVTHGIFWHIRRRAEKGEAYYKKKTRKKITVDANASGYMALPAAKKPADRTISFPIGTDPSGPRVVVQGTKEQIAQMLMEVLTK